MSDFKLVPARMLLDKETIGAINFHCGDGADGQFGEYSDGLLWIGTVTDDDGKEVYGLHLATAEYPEEGSTTLVEFAAPVVERQDPIYQVAARLDSTKSAWVDVDKESFDEYTARGDSWITRTLYTSPPAPVAVVLPPVTKIYDDRYHIDVEYFLADEVIDALKAAGVGACLDKVKELNQ